MDTVGGAPSPRLTRKGLATRARILDAAAQLILERGVAGTGIEDVRHAAGVSGSQMTHYFQDKHTLIKDVVAWNAEATLADHRMPVLGELDTFDALHTWAELIVERQRQRDCQGGCQFGSLAGQLVESDSEIRGDFADGFRRWSELFRHGLATMRARGDLRPDADPNQLAYVLLSGMQGGMLLTQVLREITPLRSALDAVIAYVESFAATP
jgi:AcrR family transcriptional regulator